MVVEAVGPVAGRGDERRITADDDVATILEGEKHESTNAAKIAVLLTFFAELRCPECRAF